MLGMVIGATIVWWFINTSGLQPVPPPAAISTDVSATTSGPVLPASNPHRLRIPTVGIDTAFEGSLGIDENQEIAVPESYEEVGWYKHGPTPGELGPSVILGHVDSYSGPAVFWPLQKVSVGDVVYVDRQDGSTATFVVTELEQPNQNDFPTKRVYGDIDHAGLRLITCTGTYDRGIQRYSHNLIVYAKLVEVAD